MSRFLHFLHFTKFTTQIQRSETSPLPQTKHPSSSVIRLQSVTSLPFWTAPFLFISLHGAGLFCPSEGRQWVFWPCTAHNVAKTKNHTFIESVVCLACLIGLLTHFKNECNQDWMKWNVRKNMPRNKGIQKLQKIQETNLKRTLWSAALDDLWDVPAWWPRTWHHSTLTWYALKTL